MGGSLHLVHSEDVGEFVKVFFTQRSGDRVYGDFVLEHPSDDSSSWSATVSRRPVFLGRSKRLRSLCSPFYKSVPSARRDRHRRDKPPSHMNRS